MSSANAGIAVEDHCVDCNRVCDLIFVGYIFQNLNVFDDKIIWWYCSSLLKCDELKCVKDISYLFTYAIVICDILYESHNTIYSHYWAPEFVMP